MPRKRAASWCRVTHVFAGIAAAPEDTITLDISPFVYPLSWGRQQEACGLFSPGHPHYYCVGGRDLSVARGPPPLRRFTVPLVGMVHGPQVHIAAFSVEGVAGTRSSHGAYNGVVPRAHTSSFSGTLTGRSKGLQGTSWRPMRGDRWARFWSQPSA